MKEGQYSPNHFHWYKTEDIINRGGGNILIRIYNSLPDESIDKKSDVTVHCDGRTYMVESFMDAMFSAKDKGNAYVRKALQYIALNEETDLKLTKVAEYLGVSPNYFSTLFHRTVGESFREHLCRVRIEESKRLPLSTNIPLNQISLAVGFSD